jgi:hypothetical protein
VIRLAAVILLLACGPSESDEPSARDAAVDAAGAIDASVQPDRYPTFHEPCSIEAPDCLGRLTNEPAQPRGRRCVGHLSPAPRQLRALDRKGAADGRQQSGGGASDGVHHVVGRC